MFIAYAHIKFHMPDSRNLLLIFIKLEAEENVCMASMLLFYILLKHLKKKYFYVGRLVTLAVSRLM
jgi:hypothetical protein